MVLLSGDVRDVQEHRPAIGDAELGPNLASIHRVIEPVRIERVVDNAATRVITPSAMPDGVHRTLTAGDDVCGKAVNELAHDAPLQLPRHRFMPAVVSGMEVGDANADARTRREHEDWPGRMQDVRVDHVV